MHIFEQKIISITLALSQKNDIEKWPLLTSFQCGAYRRHQRPTQSHLSRNCIDSYISNIFLTFLFHRKSVEAVDQCGWADSDSGALELGCCRVL